MNRVIIICEGQTEQEFCKKILYPYFLEKGILVEAPRIKKTMGGIVSWNTLKNQILNHLQSDKSSVVTTLIDYYGIKPSHGYPKWKIAEQQIDKNLRMEILEQGMKDDIDENINIRFLPYFQLHEFEGLLFIGVEIFYELFYEHEIVNKEELEKIFIQFDNPEMINDSPDTTPSKRLKRIISGYNKEVYGNIIAEQIGLERIRNKSPRFDAWIKKISLITK
ncbi:MAG TPA: DUF4276 family protein [Saprospiraceae bacterium]|nr:DUF4276 family protein [Saprospiraceae bacterium]